MQTILVAVQSESFCEAFLRSAEERFNTEMCHDGMQVLERFRSCKPDILVLDMELPGMDGISILRTLRNVGYRTPVVALTACNQSTYVSQMMTRYDVECIMGKPCVATSVLKNISEILACYNDQEQQRDLNKNIDLLLLDLNVRSQFGGYPCLIEAIKLYNKDSTQQITKTIYPEVAKICGGSPKRVERAIRTCIHDAWMHRNDDTWHMYFTPGRKEHTPPTNRRFITRLAMCLKNIKTG